MSYAPEHARAELGYALSREREFIKGAYRDMKLYSILRSEYGDATTRRRRG